MCSVLSPAAKSFDKSTVEMKEPWLTQKQAHDTFSGKSTLALPLKFSPTSQPETSLTPARDQKPLWWE